jgi:hypothetical protein
MQTLDADQIVQWLNEAHIPHYMCGDCHGLHLNDIQSMEGVMESRLFVEADCLLFFTELELRPSMLMKMLADNSRLNMTYTHLKIFVDLLDDSLPRLVIQDTLPHTAGLAYEQFHLFLENSIQATLELIEECQQLDYLGGSEVEQAPSTRSAVH